MPKKHKDKADGNDTDDPRLENGIEWVDRNVKVNSRWKEEGIERPNILTRKPKESHTNRMNKAKTGASVLKDKIEDLDQISMEYGKNRKEIQMKCGKPWRNKSFRLQE